MNPTVESMRLAIGADGWLKGVVCVPSPNFDARPADVALSLIVIHAISLPPGNFGGTAIEEFFTNTLDPEAHPYFAGIAAQRVSAHFLIRRDGQIIQFVSCASRAWHAGTSCWQGRDRCNDFALGIELEGDDYNAFAEAQYRSLDALRVTLCGQYPIAAIVGHADVAPGRKTDPGPYFDWSRMGGHFATTHVEG